MNLNKKGQFKFFCKKVVIFKSNAPIFLLFQN